MIDDEQFSKLLHASEPSVPMVDRSAVQRCLTRSPQVAQTTHSQPNRNGSLLAYLALSALVVALSLSPLIRPSQRLATVSKARQPHAQDLSAARQLTTDDGDTGSQTAWNVYAAGENNDEDWHAFQRSVLASNDLEQDLRRRIENSHSRVAILPKTELEAAASLVMLAANSNKHADQVSQVAKHLYPNQFRLLVSRSQSQPSP